jgi:hypothetical protein
MPFISQRADEASKTAVYLIESRRSIKDPPRRSAYETWENKEV